MVDPSLSLAMSMHASRGTYALLLGSGVSQPSGIPTGWEIVLDLIRKLAVLKGEDCEPDPEYWYRSISGSQPDYSDILDQVTRSSADRAQLMRAYFEPNENELQEGRKLPSRAHRAIAKLVATGYVRVVVTTNFDRLTEQALMDEGIQPTVISTVDSILGALPMMHSPCTVIKVHGDYLDSRLRNTARELASYEPPFNHLLDRVFDEFGLVICGWSAEWDVALRGAIERCGTHRYATYWAVRGSLGPIAEKLAALRRAAIVKIADADSFFADLADRIRAVEEYSLADPVSARVAVARLKRYLSTEEQRISLHDLVVSETERAYRGTRGERYPVGVVSQLTGQDLKGRLIGYESELHVLLPLMICGAYWATPSQHELFLRSFKRIAGGLHPMSGSATLLNMRRYPALILLYGLGVSAIARDNYQFVRELLLTRLSVGTNGLDRPVTAVFSAGAVLAPDLQRRLPGYESQYTPLSNHLFSVLREPLREYLPDDALYDQAFDWFEYLFGLVHCDLETTTDELTRLKAGPGLWCLRGPVGRYMWKGEYGGPSIQQETALRQGNLYPDKVAGVLRAGFFGSGGSLRDDRYRDIKLGFDTFVAQMRHELGVF